MILENPNEIRDRIFCEIKELVSELVPIQSVEDLGNNHEKVKILYDKTIFLKKLYEEGVLSEQKEENNESSVSGVWESFSGSLENLHDYEEITIDKKENPYIDNLVVEEINKISSPKTEEKVIDKNSKQEIKLEPIKKDLNLVSENKEEKTVNRDVKKNLFNLDLNDRITFLKTLFSGDEVEMTITLDKLYNYKTLLEANEYLSEVYHKRSWSSVDEYAQRLWSLVERRFQ